MAISGSDFVSPTFSKSYARYQALYFFALKKRSPWENRSEIVASPIKVIV